MKKILALLALLVAAARGQCNLSQTLLVAFELDSVLFDTAASITAAVAGALPDVPDAAQFAAAWLSAYGASANASFTPPQVAPLPQPFPYAVRGALDAALAAANRSAAHPPGSLAYEALAGAFSTSLQPYAETALALARLSSAGLALATLSNIDRDAQVNASRALPPLAFQLSSDFPIGAFKPAAAIYAQVLAATGFAASQVLVIEGNSSNAAAAAELGLQAGLVRSAALPPPRQQPCFAVANLTQAADYLLAQLQPAPASASPSPTPSDSPSATPSSGLTPSATASPSPTPPDSPSATPSGGLTPTGTPSASGTGSPSASPSPTPSDSASPSPTPSATPSATPSPTPTLSSGASPTGTPSASPSPAGTPSASPSPSGSPSRAAPPPSPSHTPSATEGGEGGGGEEGAAAGAAPPSAELSPGGVAGLIIGLLLAAALGVACFSAQALSYAVGGVVWCLRWRGRGAAGAAAAGAGALDKGAFVVAQTFNPLGAQRSSEAGRSAGMVV